MSKKPTHLFYTLDETIPIHTQLTDMLVKRYADEQPLGGTTALFFQHQLANQVPMADALIRLGLDPGKIYWVDIPYTSHSKVRKALQDLGIPKGNFRTCDDFTLLEKYALYQRRRAIRVYEELHKLAPEQLLVLDDGAYFLEAAACFERRFNRCVIVEQTSRGFKKIAKNAAMQALLEEFPLIDVARSVPKGDLESPFIGAAVCASLSHHLVNRLSRPTKEVRCLVLGYGYIGKEVTRFLSQGGEFDHGNIYVCDPHNRKEIAESPYKSWVRPDGGRFDLVLGCSGTTSFDVGDFVFLNEGAVLVSASSGAVEFNRRNIVEWAKLSDSDALRIGDVDEGNLHAQIPIHFPGRNVTLLNGGFPANFDGRITCVPTRYMQITLALMVQAAVQAVRAEKPGVHSLDEDICLYLTDAYYREVEDVLDMLPEREEVKHRIRMEHGHKNVTED